MESGASRHHGGRSPGGGRSPLNPAEALAAPCWGAWGSARGGAAQPEAPQPELGGAVVTARRALCWLGATWASVDLRSAAPGPGGGRLRVSRREKAKQSYSPLTLSPPRGTLAKGSPQPDSRWRLDCSPD